MRLHRLKGCVENSRLLTQILCAGTIFGPEHDGRIVSRKFGKTLVKFEIRAVFHGET